MGYARQKVTVTSRVHRNTSSKPKSTGQRIASKRNKNGKIRKAVRHM